MLHFEESGHRVIRGCKQYTVCAHVFLMRTVSQRLLSDFLAKFVVITGTHSTHLRGSFDLRFC